MDKKKKLLDLIIEQGILPLYFHPGKDISAEVLKTLYRAGIRAVEYTNRGGTALENFLHLRKIADKELPGLQLGMGTIKNKIDATEFINEGADFIVCPGVTEEVAEVVHRNDLLWVPGCATATEIMKAEELEANLVKLFPGSLLGPSFVTAVKDIFPDLLFMPTGGVETTNENMGAWFKAGVSAVGLGSKLINKELMEAKNFAAIESLTREALQIVQKIKNG
jgi:2-dehydro-3-deoxyphosphogluconate aldolase / (4S)-4-hydroxy-2-oxoglutarate aldolase